MPGSSPSSPPGRAIFERRQGQLNLACAHCHDDNWGQKLAGIAMPQGHPTGYPLYRLEWQTLGSLQRRLRNCLIGMRAESYAYGAPEYVALETFLMWRARGMADGEPGRAALRVTGARRVLGFGLARHHFIVGMTNSAPSFTPEGQREVTVLVLV